MRGSYVWAAILTAWLSFSPGYAQTDRLQQSQIELLRLDVEKFMATREYSTVLQKISGFRQLGVAMPLEFLAIEARLSADSGDVLRSKKVLDEYFARAPKTDKDYSESEKVLLAVTPHLAAAEAERAAAARKAADAEATVAKSRDALMAATKSARTKIETTVAGRVKYIQDCRECPKLAVVPAGTFQMGDLSGIGSKDERPVHAVSIAKPFAVGVYEVTFAEWDACVAAGGCVTNPSDEGWGRGARPVINVTWDDAQSYLKWLSAKTGKTYRLPSDAEWEYAARAGSSTDYSWGNTPSHEYANYGKDECCEGYAEGSDRWVNTAPVGSFAPNAWGLYDVHGNVREWVEDCWHEDGHIGARADGGPRLEGCEANHKTYRGGSWSVMPWLLRTSNHGKSAQDVSFKNLGFRVVRELD